MKVRIKIPLNIAHKKHIEEMMLWGIETELNFELYTWENEYSTYGNRQLTNRWSVWSIEPQDYILFVLMWGGNAHRVKRKKEKET